MEVPKQLTPLKGNDDERSVEIRKLTKGSSSQKRVIAQTLSALSRTTDLTESQRVWVALCKNMDFLSLVSELISINLKDDLESNERRRDIVIEQLSKLIRSSGITNILVQQQNQSNKTSVDEVIERIQMYKAKEQGYELISREETDEDITIILRKNKIL